MFLFGLAKTYVHTSNIENWIPEVQCNLIVVVRLKQKFYCLRF